MAGDCGGGALQSGLPRRELGQTGLAVSTLGLGGAGLLMDQHASVTDAEAVAVVERALDLGVTAFDTSPAYGARRSERRLGIALGGRDDAVVLTKVGLYDEDGGYRFDYGGDATLRSVEASLAALRREAVDVLQLHELTAERWDEAFAADGAVAALQTCREQGLALRVGVTGSEPETLRRAVGTGAFDTVMVWRAWNLLDRSAEPVLEAASRRGMGVLVGGPFASGILATGAGPDAQLHYAPADVATSARVTALEVACREHGAPLATCALHGALDPRVACVLAAVDDRSQLEANVAALAGPRPAGALAALDLPGAAA